MPYQLRGKTIYSKKGGKWHKKQTGKSVSSAKRALQLLRGLEAGSITKADIKARARKKASTARKIKRTLKVGKN